MVVPEHIREDLQRNLDYPDKCACGNMPVADVTQVGDTKFSAWNDFSCYKVVCQAMCNTRCNVCGHVAMKLDRCFASRQVAEEQ